MNLPEPIPAYQRWLNLVGSRQGLFYNQGPSQAIVSSGAMPPPYAIDPQPEYHIVKFGGDWGGLWGSPEQWGKLSPHHTAEKVIPMIYLLPGSYQSYRDMIGGLFHDGYPAVVLDVEMEWQGYESVLQALLNDLNLPDNLVAVTGYAWFWGWDDKGAAFGKVIDNADVVYMPQCYLYNLSNYQPEYAKELSDREILRVMPRKAPEVVSLMDFWALRFGVYDYTKPTAVWYSEMFDVHSEIYSPSARQDWSTFYHGTYTPDESVLAKEVLASRSYSTLGSYLADLSGHIPPANVPGRELYNLALEEYHKLTKYL